MSARSQTFIAIIAATLMLETLLSTARADDPLRDLHFITEHYATFNFMESGILQGSAVDFFYACSPSPDLRKRRRTLKSCPGHAGIALLKRKKTPSCS